MALIYSRQNLQNIQISPHKIKRSHQRRQFDVAGDGQAFTLSFIFLNKYFLSDNVTKALHRSQDNKRRFQDCEAMMFNARGAPAAPED